MLTLKSSFFTTFLGLYIMPTSNQKPIVYEAAIDWAYTNHVKNNNQFLSHVSI